MLHFLRTVQPPSSLILQADFEMYEFECLLEELKQAQVQTKGEFDSQVYIFDALPELGLIEDDCF